MLPAKVMSQLRTVCFMVTAALKEAAGCPARAILYWSM